MNLKLLKNPMVLGAGLLIGVVLLMSKGGSAKQSSSGADANATLNSLSIAADSNKAGMQAMTTMAAISAQVAINKSQSDVTNNANVMSFISSLNNISAQLTSQVNEVNAGIVNNVITTQAATKLDRQQNANRLGLAQIQAFDNEKQLKIAAIGNIAEATTLANAKEYMALFGLQ